MSAIPKNRFITAIFLLLVLVKGWSFIMTALASIPFKYALNYVESVVAAVVLHIPHEPLLYGNLNEAPFILMPYNPVYAYLSYAMSFFQDNIFMAGRLVSITATCGVIFLTFKILKRIGLNAALAFSVSLLPWLIPMVAKHANEMLPDMTALFFTLSGLCVLHHYESLESRRGKFLFIGMMCFLLAYFTKQNYIWGSGAYTLLLLFSGRWKHLFVFAAPLLGAVMFVSVLLYFVSDGEYFKHALFSPGTLKSFGWTSFMYYWKSFLSQSFLFYGLAIIAMLVSVVHKKYWMWAFYLGLALFSSLMLGKVGSGDNYFVECSVAASIMIGILLQQSKSKPLMQGVIQVLCIAQILWAFHPMTLTPSAKAAQYVAMEKDLSVLKPILQNVEGDILSENPGLLVGLGKTVVWTPFEYTQMTAMGAFDEEVFLKKVRQGEYAVILLKTPIDRINRTSRLSPGFIQTVKKRYRLLGYKMGQFIYVPQ